MPAAARGGCGRIGTSKDTTLVDTNVISETLKIRPEARVLDRLGTRKAGDLFLASMSLGELVRDARQARDKTKRERFKRWIDHDLAAQFHGRILPFDQEAAVSWGEIMGDGDRLGRPKPMADVQIAAVARRNNRSWSQATPEISWA